MEKIYGELIYGCGNGAKFNTSKILVMSNVCLFTFNICLFIFSICLFIFNICLFIFNIGMYSVLMFIQVQHLCSLNFIYIQQSYSKCNIYILFLISSIQKFFIHSIIFYSFNIYCASLITHGSNALPTAD